MLNCSTCGYTFRRLHANKNRCICGVVYDGQGNRIDGKVVAKKPIKQEAINPQRNIVREDVGSQLANLIPQWAVANTKLDCSCKSYEAKMNRWGIAGCEERESEIVDHLVNQSSHLIPVLRLAPKSMKRVVAKQLLQTAIARTKTKLVRSSDQSLLG